MCFQFRKRDSCYGRVETGVINVNDPVEIIGIRETGKSVCTGVEMFRKLLDKGKQVIMLGYYFVV